MKLQALEYLVSNVQLVTGREVSRSVQNEGSALGKPIYAEVRVEYEPVKPYTKKDVFDEIVAILKKNNWKGSEHNITPGYFSASWLQKGDTIRIPLEASVLIRETENQVSFHLTDYNGPGVSWGEIPPIDSSSLTQLPFATHTPFPTAAIEDTGSGMRKGNDGMNLLYVPAGEFTMGSDSGNPNETPVHRVYLDDFWIDQTEVTNELYAKCVEAGQCAPPGTSSFYYFDMPGYAKYPVVYVDWEMSKAYCSWAGRRLPTEAEWEKAARGTDARTYPWGEEIDCTKANYDSLCFHETAPVGSFSAGKSPYGVYDMAGNVMEWVNDWHSAGYYYNSPTSNPMGPDSGKTRGVRGGSWASNVSGARSAFRGNLDPSSKSYYGGFRCASSLP